MKISIDKKDLLTFVPENERDVFDLGSLSPKLIRYENLFNCSTDDTNYKMSYLKISANELMHLLLKKE